jgi:hypothetical protein
MRGDQFNIGVTSCEYAENLIGKGLPNGRNITKIQYDFLKKRFTRANNRFAWERDIRFSFPYLAKSTGTTVLVHP